MWFCLLFWMFCKKSFMVYFVLNVLLFHTDLQQSIFYKRMRVLTISIIHLCWIVLVLFFIYSKSKVELVKPCNRIMWLCVGLHIMNQELHWRKLLWGWLVLPWVNGKAIKPLHWFPLLSRYCSFISSRLVISLVASIFMNGGVLPS